jgi:hypothetical protein
MAVQISANICASAGVRPRRGRFHAANRDHCWFIRQMSDEHIRATYQDMARQWVTWPSRQRGSIGSCRGQRLRSRPRARRLCLREASRVAIKIILAKPIACELLDVRDLLKLIRYNYQALSFPLVPARLCLLSGAHCAFAVLIRPCHAR